MTATTAANHTAFINDLVALTGLNKAVVTEWATLENGVNNNVLGVTNGGVLATYATPAAGAQATANRLKTLSYYKGIMSSTGSSPAVQALAIAKSPWIGHAGLTYSPYYLAGFARAGLLNGLPSNPGTTTGNTSGTPATTTTSSSSSGGILGALATAASTPFIFIGIIIIAAVFVLLGGLVMLKGNG